MDTLTQYRQIIEKILTDYARIPYAYGEIETETVFDRERDHYLLVNVGMGDIRDVIPFPHSPANNSGNSEQLTTNSRVAHCSQLVAHCSLLAVH